jgi:hypothetical protein
VPAQVQPIRDALGGSANMKTITATAALLLAATIASAEPLPVPKPPGNGGRFTSLSRAQPTSRDLLLTASRSKMTPSGHAPGQWSFNN